MCKLISIFTVGLLTRIGALQPKLLARPWIRKTKNLKRTMTLVSCFVSYLLPHRRSLALFLFQIRVQEKQLCLIDPTWMRAPNSISILSSISFKVRRSRFQNSIPSLNFLLKFSSFASFWHRSLEPFRVTAASPGELHKRIQHLEGTSC